MRKKLLIHALLFLFPAMVNALVCPSSNAPLCPDSGSTLLDETYPTQAFIMSNGSGFKQTPPPSKEQQSVTKNYINTIIKSYNFKDVPQIMLAVWSEEEFNATKSAIAADLEKKKLPQEQIDKILNQLTHLKSPNYTWQQDYFESFVDLNTGAPQVRHIDSYDRMSRSTTTTMAIAGQTCGVSEGESLKHDRQSSSSGEMGGNIEGAPGGFCLVGDNQAKEFTKSFCGKEENIINLSVSWLSVGHVDEIFKIVPNHTNDGRPNECKFSLMAASPQKALDLLKDSRFKNRPYFDFGAIVDKDDLEDLVDSRSNIHSVTNFKLCGYMTQAKKASRNLQTPGAAQKGKSVFLNYLLNDVVAAAYDPFKEDCKQSVTSVTNEEMSEQFLKDKDNLLLNVAIQTSIDEDVAEIKSKILSRLPQCAKYFDVIDVPNYFEGGPLVVNDKGQAQLPKGGNINSFLPNPTNSVLMNKTLLFSDAGNSAYSDFLTDEMKKRKLETEFIATWDYAHLGMGNIHCSSHSLPYCSPRSK